MQLSRVKLKQLYRESWVPPQRRAEAEWMRASGPGPLTSWSTDPGHGQVRHLALVCCIPTVRRLLVARWTSPAKLQSTKREEASERERCALAGQRPVFTFWPHHCCVSLIKFLNLSELQLPHL